MMNFNKKILESRQKCKNFKIPYKYAITKNNSVIYR